MAVLARELADPAPQSSADAIPARLRRSGGSPRQVLVVSLIGITVLALFASRDLSSWAERLSGPLAERTQNFASAWDHAMAALGLASPHDALHSAVRRFLEYQWDHGP
jgi:hypothetical protein